MSSARTRLIRSVSEPIKLLLGLPDPRKMSVGVASLKVRPRTEHHQAEKRAANAQHEEASASSVRVSEVDPGDGVGSLLSNRAKRPRAGEDEARDPLDVGTAIHALDRERTEDLVSPVLESALSGGASAALNRTFTIAVPGMAGRGRRGSLGGTHA